MIDNYIMWMGGAVVVVVDCDDDGIDLLQ